MMTTTTMIVMTIDNDDVSEGESASKGADEGGGEVQERGKGSLHTKPSSPLLRQ